MKTALFPGSFDPFTAGHKALVEEALRLFDRVVIAVGVNVGKGGLLTVENRMRLIGDVFCNESRVEVTSYSGLTGEYCLNNGIGFMLRGIRGAGDFDFERNLAQTNRMLYPALTTIALIAPAGLSCVSSSAVREMVRFGADPSGMLPAGIDLKDYM